MRLQVEGAEALALDDNRLRLTTSLGEFSLPLLQAVSTDGTSLDLPATRPVIAGRAIRAPFVTPQANLQFSTLQSPQNNPNDLVYSTFLGGSNDDIGLGVAVDGAGNAYVTGGTRSADFPTTAGAFDMSYEGGTCGTPPDTYLCDDVFIVKLNPDGTGVAYATFLGGSGYDLGSDIVVDEAGSAYVLGWTRSTNFPTTPGAFDTSYNDGGQDAFMIKLNSTGTGLVYATFLGGSDSTDYGEALTIDGVGNAYVTGYTYSSDFPTTPGAFDPSYNGGDAFVAKLNTIGTGLVYATFLGGGDFDFGHRIAVDGTGNAYVTGRTYSPDFPITAGAFDVSYNGGDYDAFVVKLNAAGTGLVYATFLGGSNGDAGLGVTVDGVGSVYVTGFTYSSDFPTTVGAFDTALNWGDAFVAKLNAAGTGLAYATFLGGSGFDVSWTVAVDGMGSAYVTGQTVSDDFPITPGAFDASHNGQGDIFVVKLNTVGTGLAYATFLGGSASDSNFNRGIALDEANNIYVAGQTESSDFPTTTSAFDTSHNGDDDAFVAKLALHPNLSPSTKQASAVRVAPGQLVTYTVTLSNIGGNDAPNAHLTDTLPTSLIYQPGSLGADTGSYGQAGGVITWAGSLASGASAVVRYAVMVSPGLSISETAALRNAAWLDDGVNAPFGRAAVVFVNPQEVYLPLVTKQ